MTKIHGDGASIIAAGITALLADETGGKRTLGWLAKRTGIPYSTLKKRRARPGLFTTDQLFALADAFGTDLQGLYAAGEAALAPRSEVA